MHRNPYAIAWLSSRWTKDKLLSPVQLHLSL